MTKLLITLGSALLLSAWISRLAELPDGYTIRAGAEYPPIWTEVQP